MQHYFIRIGSQAEIRVASALAPYSRSAEVAVRTPRGLEVAEVIAPFRGRVTDSVNHRISRPLSESDRFVLSRLQNVKRDAIESCRQQLRDSGCDAVLLDVDVLLDGGTILMQFLGDVGGTAERIANDVAAHYESIVHREDLTLAAGDECGSGCGSCSGSCSTCHS